MDHLVSVHTLLTRTQKSRLRALSADQDTSMAALLRDAVDHYLRLVAGPPPEMLRRAARSCVGVLPLAAPAADSPAADRPLAWAGEDE